MNYRVFDAHCHIYPESIAQKAVEGIDRFYGHLPFFNPYDGTMGTLLRTGREAGISHFLVHSVATVPHQISSINRFIASAVTLSNGLFTGLGTLHPDSEHPEQDFSELAALGLKGVKLHPDFQRFEADSAKAMRIYDLCVQADLPVLVHTGDHRFDFLFRKNRFIDVPVTYQTGDPVSNLYLKHRHFGDFSKARNLIIDCLWKSCVF